MKQLTFFDLHTIYVIASHSRFLKMNARQIEIKVYLTKIPQSSISDIDEQIMFNLNAKSDINCCF